MVVVYSGTVTSTQVLLCCSLFRKAIENKSIKDYIPFKDGCPYAAKLADDPSMKEFLKCSKFQNKNRPFKNATTIKECQRLHLHLLVKRMESKVHAN